MTLEGLQRFDADAGLPTEIRQRITRRDCLPSQLHNTGEANSEPKTRQTGAQDTHSRVRTFEGPIHQRGLLLNIANSYDWSRQRPASFR